MVKDKEKCKERDKILLEILKEHMLFQRQQETQRMWTANIFIAIVVGTLVYSINTGLENLPWFIPLAFFIISTICLLITLKVNRVFVRTQDAMQKTFTAISHFRMNQAANWRNYMSGRRSTGGTWSFLRVRYLYVALYGVAIIGSGAWLYILNESVFWITVVSTAGLIALIVIVAELTKK